MTYKIFLLRVIAVNEPLLVMYYKATLAHRLTYGIVPFFSKPASVVKYLLVIIHKPMSTHCLFLYFLVL